MTLKRIFRKLKRFLKKGAMVLGVYFIGLLIVLTVSEKIERLEEKEQLERQNNIAMKIDK